MKKLTVYLIILLSSCINDCDHCVSTSKSINESKKTGVFVKQISCDKQFVVSQNGKDTIQFEETFIEHVFDFKNGKIEVRDNQYRLLFTANKVPSGYSIYWTIGEPQNLHFINSKVGLECILGKEYLNEDIKFYLYHVEKGKLSTIYDSMVVSQIIR